VLGETGVPSAAYCEMASPPKLPAHTAPSGEMASPQAPPRIPAPEIGLPNAGCPTGSRTLTVVLGSCVPGTQLVLDQAFPCPSSAIRPEANRSWSVNSSTRIQAVGAASRAGA
jgi:hypothetical protein